MMGYLARPEPSLRLAPTILLLLLPSVHAGGWQTDRSADHDHPDWGLWEISIHERLTASPALLASLRSEGRPIPTAARDKRLRSCMDQQSWDKHKAQISTRKNFCFVTQNTFTANGFIFRGRCEGDGLVATVSANESWAGGQQIHMTQRMTTTYPGNQGVLTRDRVVSSHLISPDCGSIVPGSPTEMK